MIDLKNQELIDKDFESDLDDLIRIQKACFNLPKIFITLDEAGWLWCHVSSAVQASWLDVPNDATDYGLGIINYIEASEGFTTYEEWTKEIN